MSVGHGGLLKLSRVGQPRCTGKSDWAFGGNDWVARPERPQARLDPKKWKSGSVLHEQMLAKLVQRPKSFAVLARHWQTVRVAQSEVDRCGVSQVPVSFDARYCEERDGLSGCSGRVSLPTNLNTCSCYCLIRAGPRRPSFLPFALTCLSLTLLCLPPALYSFCEHIYIHIQCWQCPLLRPTYARSPAWRRVLVPAQERLEQLP